MAIASWRMRATTVLATESSAMNVAIASRELARTLVLIGRERRLPATAPMSPVRRHSRGVVGSLVVSRHAGRRLDGSMRAGGRRSEVVLVEPLRAIPTPRQD